MSPNAMRAAVAKVLERHCEGLYKDEKEIMRALPALLDRVALLETPWPWDAEDVTPERTERGRILYPAGDEMLSITPEYAIQLGAALIRAAGSK